MFSQIGRYLSVTPLDLIEAFYHSFGILKSYYPECVGLPPNVLLPKGIGFEVGNFSQTLH